MGKLSGKIAIVTGASSGVGAGIAKVLAAHGASVVLCARRQEKLDEIRREIENRDNEGEVMTVACASCVIFIIRVFPSAQLSRRIRFCFQAAGSHSSIANKISYRSGCA